jgi:hypothetical protein
MSNKENIPNPPHETDKSYESFYKHLLLQSLIWGHGISKYIELRKRPVFDTHYDPDYWADKNRRCNYRSFGG